MTIPRIQSNINDMQKDVKMWLDVEKFKRLDSTYTKNESMIKTLNLYFDFLLIPSLLLNVLLSYKIISYFVGYVILFVWFCFVKFILTYYYKRKQQQILNQYIESNKEK